MSETAAKLPRPRIETLLHNPETLARSWSIQTNLMIGTLAVRVACGIAAAHGAGRSLATEGSVRIFIEYDPTLIAHILAVKGANERYLFGSENPDRGVSMVRAFQPPAANARPCQVRQYVATPGFSPGIKENRNTFDDEADASRAIATAIVSMAFAYSSVIQQSFPALDDPDWPRRLDEHSRKLAYEADVSAIRYQKWEQREVLELGKLSEIYEWWNDPAFPPPEHCRPYPTRPRTRRWGPKKSY